MAPLTCSALQQLFVGKGRRSSTHILSPEGLVSSAKTTSWCLKKWNHNSNSHTLWSSGPCGGSNVESLEESLLCLFCNWGNHLLTSPPCTHKSTCLANSLWMPRGKLAPKPGGTKWSSIETWDALDCTFTSHVRTANGMTWNDLNQTTKNGSFHLVHSFISSKNEERVPHLEKYGHLHNTKWQNQCVPFFKQQNTNPQWFFDVFCSNCWIREASRWITSKSCIRVNLQIPPTKARKWNSTRSKSFMARSCTRKQWQSVGNHPRTSPYWWDNGT